MTTVPPDGPGTPEGENEPPPLTEADLERFMAELGTTPETDADPEAAYVDGERPEDAEPYVPGAAAADEAEAQRYALVFTPVARAADLARLCAASSIDILAVPTGTGVIAARRIAEPRRLDDWDISELLGGGAAGAEESDGEDSTVPSEAGQLAADLSVLIRYPVVLVVAELATDVGVEAGLSGHVTAVRYEGGRAVGAMSPGLLLAQADQVAEDLVLGRVRPEAVPGAVDSTDIDPDPGPGRGLFGRRR